MEFCQCAIDMSLQSSHRVYKHGALLVRKNRIISSGYNDEHYHAEAMAIKRCLQRVLQEGK